MLTNAEWREKPQEVIPPWKEEVEDHILLKRETKIIKEEIITANLEQEVVTNLLEVIDQECREVQETVRDL